jgi:hypothetical protein
VQLNIAHVIYALNFSHVAYIWSFQSYLLDTYIDSFKLIIFFSIYPLLHTLLNLWPWSYGSWTYNYLCNQCLSTLMLWVRISIRSICTTLCDKVCRRLATGWWFLWVLRFPPQLKLTATIYLKYCWTWRLASTIKHLLAFTLNPSIQMFSVW